MTLRELGEKSGFENRGDVRIMFLKNYYRKKRKSHTTFDMGIEEDNSYREHNNPDDEGILYDNLD